MALDHQQALRGLRRMAVPHAFVRDLARHFAVVNKEGPVARMLSRSGGLDGVWAKDGQYLGTQRSLPFHASGPS